jgi:cold shock CspA family protein
MTAVVTAVVTSDMTRGCCFCEVDETHQSLFVHINQVKDSRCLHLGDRIHLEVIPNSRRPGQMMAGNVLYIGRINVRQTSNGGAL